MSIVYFLKWTHGNNGHFMGCCSNEISKLKKIAKENMLNESNIEERFFNFEIDDIKESFSIVKVDDNSNTFSELGQYFRKREEAQEYIKKMCGTNNIYKLQLKAVDVI